jgi:hypothetical protein
MKRKIISALLAAMVLLLSGCGSFLHREYSVVEPHSSDYYENEDVLRAESYQDVVNDLLLLVGEQEKTGTVWLYRGAEELDAAAIAERACQEVQKQTPLGAYAVEYITYKVDNTPRNYIAIELTLGYRRTAQQMDAIVHATSISALPDLLNAAAQNHTAELTVQMNYFENQQAEVLSIVQQVQRAQQGETADPWQVNFYPEGANVGIIEIILKK